MSKLLIIQNITREGPGLLEDVLRTEGVAFDTANLDKNETLPELGSYKALVVLGGPDSANDETTKMTGELAYIKQALDAGTPYLGICLGLQTLVKAAGGKVVKGETKEIGFINPDGKQHTVSLTEAGKTDPLLNSLPEELAVFQLHGETVELTPSMTLLATGKFCRNQIVKVADKAYGIQSHFELTPEMLAVWAAQDPDLMPLGNDKLQADFAAIQQPYTNTGNILLKNFLSLAGLTNK
jgi:GMP synthase-like glutamine amidotransferase